MEIGIEEDEIRGQHADDLVGLAAQPDVLADRVIAAAEQPLPGAMGEDDDLLLSEFALLLGEELAAIRLRAEHPEERRRDEHRLDAFGLCQPAAADRDAGLAEQRRLLERRHVALAVEVVGHAVGAAGLDARAGVFIEEADQPVGLGKRQRLEQDAVDDRENCDVGRQTQGQGRNGREREAAILPEQPSGKAQILQQSFHGYVSLRSQERQGSHCVTGT